MSVFSRFQYVNFRSAAAGRFTAEARLAQAACLLLRIKVFQEDDKSFLLWGTFRDDL